ncbi:hypothetical protein GOODEAATRI_013895, partial [Goodea atripinnis]
YLLQPKGTGSKSKSDDLGQLRLKLHYIEDTVLPSACYTPLCNLLLKSPDVKVTPQPKHQLNLNHWSMLCLEINVGHLLFSFSFTSLLLFDPLSFPVAHFQFFG